LAQETTSAQAGLIADLLSTLIRLQGHLRLYGDDNARIGQTTARLFDLLGQLFEREDPLSIYVARHGFIYGDGFINRSSAVFASFANHLFQHGIASLTLHSGIQPQSIHGFLTLVNRRPSETWDEGGIENCLRLRRISHLEVREMVEQDFQLSGGGAEEGHAGLPDRSLLWERLAASIAREQLLLDADGLLAGELTPAALAELTNRGLQETPAETGNALARELSRFLISLSHEKIRLYRLKAIRQLAEYVNALTPELRDLFLRNAFNLNLEPDLLEGFLTGLSDRVVLDTLHDASTTGYTPPVILQLLGRLADERGITDAAAAPAAIATRAGAARLKTLFKADDFDDYVPKQYQEALLNIVRSEGLPQRTTARIETLKATLEQSFLDRHVGDILLEILRGGADRIQAGSIGGCLISTLELYLRSREYGRFLELYRLCDGNGIDGETRSKVAAYLSSEEFAATVISGLLQGDRDAAGGIRELVHGLEPYLVEPLLDRLGVETDRSVRHTYLTVLAGLGRECRAQAVARLADSRWFVTRNLLYLLREFGDPAMLPHVRRYLDHPHPKVRHEALRTCLLLRDAQAVPALLKALESRDESALIRSIGLAGGCSDPQVAARLAALLREAALLKYRLEVRKAAAKSLAMASPLLALPAFQAVLASRSLFHAQLHDSLKIEIMTLLDRLPADAAVRLLQDQLTSRSAEVAYAARAALGRITGARAHE